LNFLGYTALLAVPTNLLDLRSRFIPMNRSDVILVRCAACDLSIPEVGWQILIQLRADNELFISHKVGHFIAMGFSLEVQRALRYREKCKEERGKR